MAAQRERVKCQKSSKREEVLLDRSLKSSHGFDSRCSCLPHSPPFAFAAPRHHLFPSTKSPTLSSLPNSFSGARCRCCSPSFSPLPFFVVVTFIYSFGRMCIQKRYNVNNKVSRNAGECERHNTPCTGCICVAVPATATDQRSDL